MLVASYIYIGQFAPKDTTQLWVEPKGGGEVSLHVFSDGGWKIVGGGDGKSAYELAVEKGYSGTLDEWLDSLQGKSLTYNDLTDVQRAELAQDAVAAANRAAQAVETIEAAINDLDPSQSAEDAVVALAARQGVLENGLSALGPKIGQYVTNASPANGTTLLTSSDVSEGDVVYYKLNVGTPSGYNAYLELQDSNGDRLLIKNGSTTVFSFIYGKTSISTTTNDYEGKIVIPNGFSKLVYKYNAPDAKIVYLTTEKDVQNVASVVVSDQKSLSENTWEKIVRLAYNGTEASLKWSRALSIGNEYRMKIVCSQSTSLRVSLANGTNVQALDGVIVRANKPVLVDFTTSFDNINALASTSYISSNSGVYFEILRKKGISEYIQESNSLNSIASQIKRGKYIKDDILFAQGELVEGKVYEFSITQDLNTTSYIAFYNNTDTRIAVYGRTSTNLPTTVVGTLTVPEGASYAKIYVGTNDFCTLNYLRPKNVNAGDNDNANAAIYKDMSRNLYECGQLVNVGKSYEAETALFTSDDVAVGDTIKYSLHVGTPTNVNYYIALWDGNSTRLAIYGKTYLQQVANDYVGEFEIPTGFAKATIMGSATDGTVVYLSNKYSNKSLFDKIAENKTSTDAAIDEIRSTIATIDGVKNVNVVNAVTFSSPTAIIANNDAGSTQYDSRNIGFACILKVSDSMYYLYYSGMGTAGTGDNSQKLCFAYSTDGLTYTRGFPQGVSEPSSGIEGTNVLNSDDIGVIKEMCVFKVNDSAYPYRMIANDGTYTMRMYKSTDGINFDFTNGKMCCKGQRDTQISAIVRGNTIKLFVRSSRYSTAHSNGTRAIGIAYCDIDGNVLSPAFCALEYDSLYNAGASAIDDHREILFPSFYNDDRSTELFGGMGGDDSMTLKCLILNGERVDDVVIDTSTLLGSNDKSFYVMPNMVDIGGDLYVLVQVRNSTHNHFATGDVSKLKLAKVTLSHTTT